MIVLFIAEAKGIINFIAGPEYPVSISILRILIWPTALIFFSALFNYGIIAIEEQKRTIKYFLATALIALTGYLIFIPRFSYYGAAYMTLVAEFLMAAFAFLSFTKIFWLENKFYSFNQGFDYFNRGLFIIKCFKT